MNPVEKPFDIAVSIEKGGEIFYDREHTLKPAEGKNATSVEITTNEMGERTHYEATFTLETDSQTHTASTASDTLEVEEENVECFDIYAVLDSENRIETFHRYHESCSIEGQEDNDRKPTE